MELGANGHLVEAGDQTPLIEKPRHAVSERSQALRRSSHSSKIGRLISSDIPKFVVNDSKNDNTQHLAGMYDRFTHLSRQ